MSEHSSSQKPVDDEIDLSVLIKAIKNFIKNILQSVFNIFSFFYKHKFVLIGLIVLGGVLGYFYDKNFEKSYKNEMLILPNYSSVDYVYSKIDAIGKKIKAEDSLFLKNIFGADYKKIKSVEIEPVIDIYNFLSKNETNKELFELLFEEEADIEFIENPINSKNYKFHKIFLEVKGEDKHEDFSNALFTFINSNAYYDNMNVLSRESLKLQIEENNEIINQIDSIIAYAKKRQSIGVNSSGLSFSDNRGLKELLDKKNYLIERRVILKIELVNQTDTVKLITSNHKLLETDEFLKKDKVKLFPIFFVLLYCAIFFLRHISKMAKAFNS